MTSQVELIQQKEILMNDMLNQLSHWDESTEEALRILAENDEAIKLMREIDQKLTMNEQVAYNEKQQVVWEEIIQKQEDLLEFIKEEKKRTAEQLVQMGNKEKIVSNYIGLQKESAIIGKNY